MRASSAAHRNMQIQTANSALKNYTEHDKQGKHSDTRDALVGPVNGLLAFFAHIVSTLLE